MATNGQVHIVTGNDNVWVRFMLLNWLILVTILSESKAYSKLLHIKLV